MEPKTSTQIAAGTPDPGAAQGLIETLMTLLAELRGSVHDHLQIAALEGERAAMSIVWITVFSIVAGLLIAATWLAVAGALVLWLIDVGLHASLALVLGALINLLGACGFAFLILEKSQALRFPITLGAFNNDNTDAARENAQAKKPS